jgi:hypothetical protein
VFLPGRFVRSAVVIAALSGMLVVGVSAAPVASAAEPPLPDLIITSVFPQGMQTGAPPGTRINPSATVKNVGTVATPVDTIIGAYFTLEPVQEVLVARRLSWQHRASLAPGASVTLEVDSWHHFWLAEEGIHTVTAKVNVTGRIPETDLNNNAMSAEFTIPSTPSDLIVTAVSPASGAIGDHVVPSATVENINWMPTKAGVIVGVAFQIEGTTVWSNTNTASLAAGASVTLTANSGLSGTNYWVATEGSHTITANVNAMSRIPETDRSNNTLVSTITVPP